MSCYHRSGCYNPWPGQNQKPEQLQRQAQRQGQDQDQHQAQGQDQDQNQRNVFREIGNVNIDIDNQNIVFAVLLILAFFSGHLDGHSIQEMLESFRAK